MLLLHTCRERVCPGFFPTRTPDSLVASFHFTLTTAVSTLCYIIYHNKPFSKKKMTTKMNINKRCIQTPAYYHIFTLYLVVFTWSLVKV